MATAVAQPAPAHPHGFLLHHHHHHQPPTRSDAAPVSVVPKPAPSDPYYGHEETAKICDRFIRHVFNCPAGSVPPTQSANLKPTESSLRLDRFIAYAFHRTRLPISVAYHSLFLLNRLKSRYPAASCAFGHRLFLTSYMLSSKVICDDTYSNKSWAIVGQGFYDLRDVNLMEREMIHYLSWDLTISASDLAAFSDRAKATYRKGVPKAPYVVIPDTSREKDMFGKGHIEEKEKKVVPLPAEVPKQPSYPISDAPPPYASAPYPSHPIEDHNNNSPFSDSSSSSSDSSSRESSPPSPCLQTPPDDVASPHGLHPNGKPVPIDFTGGDPTKLPIAQIHDTERGYGWAQTTGW